ncbi:MAG: MBL fold metallo-hydrolase [Clostridiales bacterium]|nr:MBL fold metallo-hydrolase [Clostridiales bacterium]
MIIQSMGHAFFTLTLENGAVIATDPYHAFYHYPNRMIKADVCTVSHHHHDHDGVASLQPGAQVIETKGTHRFGEIDVTITGVPTWHDHHEGARRGDNLFFVIEAEGLRIGHAGDLGHLPTEKQLKKIGKLDVLLLPVGGTYTVDASEALHVREMLEPAVCIPMHYRTQYNPDMRVTDLDTFLNLAKVKPEPMPLVRITAGDISQRDAIVVLEVTP